MLLDPLEKQFHLPSRLVESANVGFLQSEVVGQKHQRFAGIGIFEANTAQMFGIILVDFDAGKHNGLIADDARVAIDLSRIVVNDYRQVNNERLYEADVISVRAIVGTPEQRCWVEREQIVQESRNNAVSGAIAGAVIGGILGHQVGNGRGNDLATAGGAVAGAVVGANVGRGSGGQQVTTQNVRRCESVPSHARPDYWDVTYRFRNQEHRVQMTTPPGDTVTVNNQGEPRV